MASNRTDKPTAPASRAAWPSLALLAALALGPAACERRPVTEHKVDKGVERVPPAPSDNADAAPASPNADATPAEPADRPWSVPQGWVEDPEPRPMRVATYTAPDSGGDVEVAVTRFGGRVGGELANINRWRGQMGLAPIGEGELESAITRFSAPGFDGYQARIESAAGVMLAAGVHDAAADETWFVRATVTDAAAADRLEAAVFGVARSIAGLEG